MVNDTYSDIISNAGGIYKYTKYLHNPHFTAPVRSPARTPRFSSQNNTTTKFYIARADSAPPYHATRTGLRTGAVSRTGTLMPNFTVVTFKMRAYSPQNSQNC